MGSIQHKSPATAQPSANLAHKSTTIASSERVVSQLPSDTLKRSASMDPELSNKTYNILWRKKTQKKNKTWDGDGKLILVTSSDTAILRDDNGIMLCRLNNASRVIHNGVFKGGSYEFELDGEAGDETTQIQPMRPVKRVAYQNPLAMKRVLKPTKLGVGLPRAKPADPKPVEAVETPLVMRSRPILGRRNQPSQTPLHDIDAENALVMPKPPNMDAFRDVVVDPILVEKLREHQREGVKFLYECVMGYREFKGHGALLADGMGLGKTLQTITLVWTLLKQNPVVSEVSTVRKVLICCPVTLVMNWKKEFKKWLGPNRVSVLAINGNQGNDKQSIAGFETTNVYQVLIIGYEKLLSLHKELERVPIDMVVCDEGHRLKSGSNKVLKVLESFQIKRRVLLSGTPIQNDLSEFYNVINFINPNVLGDFKSFQRNFMKPILRAREANCTNPKVLEAGETMSRELIRLTKQFILRRTIDELSDYLPSRSDYVLFAPPTKLQIQLLKTLEQSNHFRKIINTGHTNDSLGLITTFRKICNSPSLLKDDGLFLSICNKNAQDIENFRNELGNKLKSAKIILLARLLKEIHNLKGEKVVLISNFTQTLDILEKLLSALNFTFSRLDGSTPANLRDKIVSGFNTSSWETNFVFLLSAKSGGCGLNLIGASRLILFDNDWNPSIDTQAMARIHRDGQKRPVFIYRLLTAGCIDEKIFQRQLIKTNLSDKFLDDSNTSNEDFFNETDLKDLFTISEGTDSGTHSLMECDCSGEGIPPAEVEEEEIFEEKPEPAAVKRQPSFVSALNYTQSFDEDNEGKKKQQIKKCLVDYRHINPISGAKSGDSVIDEILSSQDGAKPVISYIFAKP